MRSLLKLATTLAVLATVLAIVLWQGGWIDSFKETEPKSLGMIDIFEETAPEIREFDIPGMAELVNETGEVVLEIGDSKFNLTTEGVINESTVEALSHIGVTLEKSSDTTYSINYSGKPLFKFKLGE